jgi:uncharacterized membrane protein
MSEPTVPPPPPPYYTPPPPPAGPGSGAVSPNRSIMIVLSYLWLLALVPFIVEKDDREVQWHARNGIVLMIAELIILVVFWVVQFGLVLTHILAFLGCLLGAVQLVLWLGILVLHIMCIVKGVNGQRLVIPMVSQYADKF